MQCYIIYLISTMATLDTRLHQCKPDVIKKLKKDASVLAMWHFLPAAVYIVIYFAVNCVGDCVPT